MQAMNTYQEWLDVLATAGIFRQNKVPVEYSSLCQLLDNPIVTINGIAILIYIPHDYPLKGILLSNPHITGEKTQRDVVASL
jgi:hypothetical protein